jgi:fatty acid desaturase
MSSALNLFDFLFQKLRSLLDPNLNPLRHAPALVRYFVTLLLAGFWCLVFGMYFGDIQNIVYNMVGHTAVISMVFVTWVVFKQSDRIYGPREGTQEWLRMPDRSSRCDEMTEDQRLEKVKELNK